MAVNNGAQRVSKGGLWNTQPVTYSKETQNLLKEMMHESKLTMFQQKHLDQALKHGKTLPLNVPPTHSHKEKIIRPNIPPSKVIQVKDYSGGVRSKDTMEKLGMFEKPDYKPRPQRCRTDKEKDKFCNIMAYGKDIPPPDVKKIRGRAMPREETKIDRFDELQEEIEDRREFLENMTALGRGDEFRNMIETEISQKVREMEIIDRKETKELNERLEKIKQEDKNEAVKGVENNAPTTQTTGDTS